MPLTSEQFDTYTNIFNTFGKKENENTVALAAGGDSGQRNGNSVWNRVLDNANGWLNSIFGGVSGIMAAKTGNYPQQQPVDNTPKILAISAVAAIVLIIIVLIIFKK